MTVQNASCLSTLARQKVSTHWTTHL